jgi:pimeloyl-ACP methyl ester carboxylesterase
MPRFALDDGHELAYTTYGEGPRVTVLLHGLLFNQRMHEALARALAARGNRVVTLDLLGHGDSDRPTDKWRYSMPAFGRQVIALLDHLDEPEAIVAGTSLGANVALEANSAAPERVRGMVVEMPVLDHALIGCAIAFTPIMIGLTAGAPAARALARVTRLIPRRRLPWQADILLDWVRQAPEPSAAVFEGLFFGRIAPPREERQMMRTPALVIGHQYDLIHPFSDAGMLASELPGARLLEASSLIELRVAPKRLTNEIAEFVDDCWKPRAASSRLRAS